MNFIAEIYNFFEVTLGLNMLSSWFLTCVIFAIVIATIIIPITCIIKRIVGR